MTISAEAISSREGDWLEFRWSQNSFLFKAVECCRKRIPAPMLFEGLYAVIIPYLILNRIGFCAPPGFVNKLILGKRSVVPFRAQQTTIAKQNITVKF